MRRVVITGMGIWSCLGKNKAEVINYTYGLGGRDLLTEHAESILEDLKEAVRYEGVERPYRYVGVRE